MERFRLADQRDLNRERRSRGGSRERRRDGCREQGWSRRRAWTAARRNVRRGSDGVRGNGRREDGDADFDWRIGARAECETKDERKGKITHKGVASICAISSRTLGPMNWLAHLHLSEDDVEVRLGNVIADFIKGEKRLALNLRIRRGVGCHMFIDSFTDAHPVFLRSRQRISPANRKFAGIVVDVFYDHFLSVRWPDYSDQPKRAFIDGIYSDFERYTETALPDARRFVVRMAEEDWLGEYETLAGIERTLARVSGRLKRPGLLVPLAAELTANYAGLDEDFAEFYPALRTGVSLWFAEHR